MRYSAPSHSSRLLWAIYGKTVLAALGAFVIMATTMQPDSNWIDTLNDTNDTFAGNNVLGNGTYVVQLLPDTPVAGQIPAANTASLPTVEALTTTGGTHDPQEDLMVNGEPTVLHGLTLLYLGLLSGAD